MTNAEARRGRARPAGFVIRVSSFVILSSFVIGNSSFTMSANPPPSETAPRPLSLGHFRPAGLNGFGDARNSYAWSIAYFEDHVYVGTNRNVLAVGALRGRVGSK